MNNTKELLRLIAENPDLPIIPLVDYEIVCEDGGRWLASFGSVCVGEYAVFNERYYEDRSDFQEDYTDYYCEELSERFNIYEQNDEFDKYLDEIADKHFIKAIIIHIDLPDIEDSLNESN